MNRHARSLLASLLLLVSGASVGVPAAAQTTTGTFVGRILDPSRAPLEGVLVRVTSLTNGFTYATRTDATGTYRIDLLPPDLYRISAEKAGFVPGTIERFQAEVNRTRTITPPPIVLVPVTASSPATATTDARLEVNSVDPTLRGSVSSDVIGRLPLPGIRSFDALALLTPGVFAPPETFGTSGPGVGRGVGTAGQFSVHGQRARANNFTVDGSDDNDPDVGVRRQGFTSPIPQPIESIAEFQITTHLADAEAGRNTGGQVNVVTRAGTNAVHGQAYVLFTDDALDARDFFDTSGLLDDSSTDTTTENPAENPYRRTQVGGTIGLPLVRDRLHVFLAGEHQRVDRTAELHFATPTEAERNEAFRLPGESNLGISVLLPTFLPLPNNPNGPLGASTFTRLVDASGRGTVATAKVDYQFAPFGRASTLSARYDLTDDRAIVPSVDEAINSSLAAATRTHNVALSLNTALGPRASNQIRLSVGRTSLGFDEVAGSPLVFSSPFEEQGTGPVGRIVVSPFSAIGVDPFTFPQRRANTAFQYADTFLFTRGGHAIKLGGDVRRLQFNSELQRNYRPQVSFTSGSLRVGLGSGDGEPVTGLAFAGFGAPSDVFQALAVDPDASLALRVTEANLFATDSWRLSPRVTLTVGLRYEYNTVPVDATGRLERELATTLADVPGAEAPDAADFADAFEAQRRVLGGRTKIYDPDANNLAPRIGFAWDVSGNGTLSVRGGYGLYYDTVLGTVVSQSRNVFPSFIPVDLGAATVSAFAGNNPQYLNPANLTLDERPLLVPGTNMLNLAPEDVPFLLGAFSLFDAFPLAFTLPEKALRTPYVHQYSLTVERSLADRYVVALSYVGSAGHKLLRFRTPNGGPYTPLVFNVVDGFGRASPPWLSSFRPETRLGAYTIFESSASSSFNALEISVERRIRDGLGFRLGYTYAHAIDDVSDVFDVAGAYALAQDELGRDGGLAAERADASFDVRHRFTAAWTAELPFWRGRPLLGGYELSGVLALQTGQPYTANTSFDVNFDGNLTDRLATTDGLVEANDGPVRLRLAEGATLAQFLPRIDPSDPQVGVVGRNTFRSAGVANLDAALAKRFEIGPGLALDARVEVFNFFNSAHFGVPVRVLEAPGFGRSTYTTVPARTVQLSLRFSF